MENFQQPVPRTHCPKGPGEIPGHNGCFRVPRAGGSGPFSQQRSAFPKDLPGVAHRLQEKAPHRAVPGWLRAGNNEGRAHCNANSPGWGDKLTQCSQDVGISTALQQAWGRDGKNMLRKMLNSHDFFQQNLLSHVCTMKILSPPLMLWHRSQKDLIWQQEWVLRNYNKAIRAPYVAVAVSRSELSTDPREMSEFPGPPAVKTEGPSTCTIR